MTSSVSCVLHLPTLQVLGFVLEAAGDATADVRTKAVRLTANRLFPQPSITAAIERHARQQLDSMVVPAPSRPSSAAAAGQPGSSPGPGAPAAPAARETPSSDREATPPSGQADAARPLVSDAAEAPAEQSGEQQQQKQQPGATGSQETAGEPAPAASGGPDEAQAAQLCALYCALCTKKHSLLRHLFEVFAQTSGGCEEVWQGTLGAGDCIAGCCRSLSDWDVPGPRHNVCMVLLLYIQNNFST